MLTLSGAVGYLTNESNIFEPKAVEMDFEAGSINTSRVCKLGTSSTSPQFLEPTNSTSTDDYAISASMICRVGSAKNARLNLNTVASTTSTKYNYTVYYSNDGDSDWYAMDTASTSGSVRTHSATALSDTWTPATTTRQTKSILFGDVVSQWMKVELDVDTASGSVYAELSKQSEN